MVAALELGSCLVLILFAEHTERVAAWYWLARYHFVIVFFGMHLLMCDGAFAGSWFYVQGLRCL